MDSHIDHFVYTWMLTCGVAHAVLQCCDLLTCFVQCNYAGALEAW